MPCLFCLGLGYTARALARRLAAEGWEIAGTSRSADGLARIRGLGYEPVAFDGLEPNASVTEALTGSTHVLVSSPPGPDGDPFLLHHGEDLERFSGDLAWIGYLSTVGVYGNHDGAWVDEETPTRPVSARSVRRVQAEEAWLELAERHRAPVHIFRLPGIYGPGRNALKTLREGRARRIIKPGQVFNRAHVDGIATALAGSIAAPYAGPHRGRIYNVADDEPCPPQDVVAFGAELLGIEPPPEVAFEDSDLTEMGRSFYGENKRVSNARMKGELRVRLAHPTYREGLKALLDAGE